MLVLVEKKTKQKTNNSKTNIWYGRKKKKTYGTEEEEKKSKIMIGIPMYIASYEKMHVSMVEVAEVSQVFFVGGRVLHVLKYFSQVTWG